MQQKDKEIVINQMLINIKIIENIELTVNRKGFELFFFLMIATKKIFFSAIEFSVTPSAATRRHHGVCVFSAQTASQLKVVLLLCQNHDNNSFRRRNAIV